MKLDKEDLVELEKLAQPLTDWLHKHGHPHATIVLQWDSIEVVESVARQPVCPPAISGEWLD